MRAELLGGACVQVGVRERMHAASQLIHNNAGHLSTVMSITFYASSSGRFRQTCTLANFDFGPWVSAPADRPPNFQSGLEGLEDPNF